MEAKKRIPGLLALKQIIETTSAYTGTMFFKSLVQQLAEILDVHGVWVTEFWPADNKLNALAFWLDGKHVEEYTYLVSNTPCEPVLTSDDICHVPSNVINLYPKDPDLPSLGAVSYMGIALHDENGSVIGHLALLDNKPMEEIPEVFAIFKILASRAAAELRREIAYQKTIDSESKLNRLVNGTSDAIIEFDANYQITQVNDAALKMFRVNQKVLLNQSVESLFNTRSARTIKSLLPKHDMLTNGKSALQVGEKMICVNSDDESIPVEISLSGYEFEGKRYFVLYIKNISQRISDKSRIRELSMETTLLKEMVDSSQFGYIIGESPQIKHCLELVNQVGPTDANVLILGETGTGKELFARAVHDASSRKSKPLVTLNCAALPAELIESELFGHVKGAFTGADAAREGRFSLANKGTLFLDEIAELPLALQAKLLRVIQEGMFEKLGSSETVHVDVRIIAATHQDLTRNVSEGKFREDLYYRLNVFPLKIPALRDRPDDLKLLINAFCQKFSKLRGMNVESPSENDIAQMINYNWPGNVRELQNIVERGIITSVNGKFNLATLNPSKNISNPQENTEVLSFDQVIEIEKQNIIRALNQTNWKIAGEGGAADLLKIPRTTLASKIKKMKIKRLAVG